MSESKENTPTPDTQKAKELDAKDRKSRREAEAKIQSDKHFEGAGKEVQK